VPLLYLNVQYLKRFKPTAKEHIIVKLHLKFIDFVVLLYGYIGYTSYKPMKIIYCRRILYRSVL